MNPEQPGRPDGDMTIRRRWRHPAPPPPRQAAPPHPPPPPPRNAAPWFPPPPPRPFPVPPPEDGRTRRLEYTPDLLPDVAYATGKSRSGWWWLFVAGGILLLVAALAVAVLFSVGS